MLYAWLIVCLASVEHCDSAHVENAIYAEQMDPRAFSSMDECYDAAVRHLFYIGRFIGLQKRVDYRFDIECVAVDGSA